MPEAIVAAAETPASPASGVILSNYLVQHTLGQGTFGKVKLAQHMPTGERVAIKILEKARIKEVADAQRVAREIKILKRIRHPNVIQLFEVIDAPRQIFLVMEFLDGGELFDYIVRHQRIREDVAVRFFHDIVDGLSYLHRKEVAHRDLKPENVLMQRRPDGYRLKIIDFGLSNTFDGGRVLKTACGSPCYAAPELLLHQPYRGEAADVWSLGVVLFAMIAGHLPYEDQNTAKLYDKILRADYKCPRWLSSAARDLLSKMFQTDPANRATIADIRRHPWYTQIMVPSQPVKSTPSSLEELNAYVVAEAEALGISRMSLAEHLMRNAHNNITATYFLLTERLLRNGGPDAAAVPTAAAPASAGAATAVTTLTAVSARAASGETAGGAVAAVRPSTASAPTQAGLRATAAASAAPARPATSAVAQRGASTDKPAPAAAAAAPGPTSRPASAAKQRPDTAVAMAPPVSARAAMSAAVPAATPVSTVIPVSAASTGAPSAAATALRKAQRNYGTRPESARAPSPTPTGAARAAPADDAPQSHAQHTTKRVAVGDLTNPRQLQQLSSQQPQSSQQQQQQPVMSLKDGHDVRPAESATAAAVQAIPERSQSRARGQQEALNGRAQGRTDSTATTRSGVDAPTSLVVVPSGGATRASVATDQLRRPSVLPTDVAPSQKAPTTMQVQPIVAPLPPAASISSAVVSQRKPSAASDAPLNAQGAPSVPVTAISVAVAAAALPQRKNDARGAVDLAATPQTTVLPAPQAKTAVAPVLNPANNLVVFAPSVATEDLPSMVPCVPVGGMDDRRRANKRSVSSGPAMQRTTRATQEQAGPSGMSDELPRDPIDSAPVDAPLPHDSTLAATSLLAATVAHDSHGAVLVHPETPAAEPRRKGPLATPPTALQHGELGTPRRGGDASFLDGEDAMAGVDVSLSVSMRDSTRVYSGFADDASFGDSLVAPVTGASETTKRAGIPSAAVSSRRAPIIELPAAPKGETAPSPSSAGSGGAKGVLFGANAAAASAPSSSHQSPAGGVDLFYVESSAAAAAAAAARSRSIGGAIVQPVDRSAAAAGGGAGKSSVQPGSGSLVVEGIAAVPTYLRYPATAPQAAVADAQDQQSQQHGHRLAQLPLSVPNARVTSPAKVTSSFMGTPPDSARSALTQPQTTVASITVSVMGVHPASASSAHQPDAQFSSTKTQALLIHTQQSAAAGAAASAASRQPLTMQQFPPPAHQTLLVEAPRSMTAAVGNRGGATTAIKVVDLPDAGGGGQAAWPIAVNGQTIASPHPPPGSSGVRQAVKPASSAVRVSVNGAPGGDAGPVTPTALAAEAIAQQQVQRVTRAGRSVSMPPTTTEWSPWSRPATAAPAPAQHAPNGRGGFFDMLVAGHGNKPSTAAQLQAQLQLQLQQQDSQPQQQQQQGHHRQHRHRVRHVSDESGPNPHADNSADAEDGSSASQTPPLARDVPTISQAERMLSPAVQRQRQHLQSVYGPPPYTLPGQQLQGAPPGFVALVVPSRPPAASAASAGSRGSRPGTASQGVRRGRQLTVARNYPQPWNPAAGDAADGGPASAGGPGEPSVRTAGLGRTSDSDQPPPPSALMNILSGGNGAAGNAAALSANDQRQPSPRPQQLMYPPQRGGASGQPAGGNARGAWQPLDEPSFGRPAVAAAPPHRQPQQQRWAGDGGRITPEPPSSYSQPDARGGGSVRTAWPQRPPSAGGSGRAPAGSSNAGGDGSSSSRPQSASRRPQPPQPQPSARERFDEAQSASLPYRQGGSTSSPRTTRVAAPSIKVEELDGGGGAPTGSAEDRLSKWAAMLSPPQPQPAGPALRTSVSPHRLSPAAGSGGTSSNNLAMSRERVRSSGGRMGSGERYMLDHGDGAGGTGATSEAVVGSSGSIAAQ